jgi:putative ABC transport system substrate-binding protein
LFPFATLAQQAGKQPATPVVGFLASASPDQWAHLVVAFERGLKEIGYADGRNVTVQYRWAEGQFDRLPALAADLVAQGVAVILAAGGSVTPQQTKAATSTIPIVFVTGGDPVANGIVPHLNRPGGNITGVTSLSTELTLKRLELLIELLPTTTIIGQLENPRNPFRGVVERSMREAMEAGGQKLVTVSASSHDELEMAFTTLVQHSAGALIVSADPFFVANSAFLVSLSARHRIPTIYSLRDYVMAGGLISYGSNFSEAYRQAGNYVGRILKGEKPGDLPVLQPTKFEMVINLKTAKMMGLTLPPTLLARADEVIE